MAFFRWLRSNSEHYLLIDAQRRVAGRLGVTPPRKPHGVKEFLWLRGFAPAYRVLPWGVRRKVLLAMPGSHRRSWAPPPRAPGSAVQQQFLRKVNPPGKGA